MVFMGVPRLSGARVKRTFFVCALSFAGCVCSAAPSLTTPIKTIYIVPSSHYDRGFVVPPKQIVAMAARHVDEVLDAAEKDPNFRWTIESVWQVLAFLEESRGQGDILPGQPQRINDLMDLIRSGRIDLSPVWGSMHSEFMGTEELNRLVYDFAALRRTYSIQSETAMMDDVPGQPFSVASVLSGSGVRYLLVGANQFVGGGTSLSPGKVPFYWEGPDGKRVLTWVSQSPRGGYTEGITDFFIDPFTGDPYLRIPGWKIFDPKLEGKSPLEIMQTGIDRLLKRYTDAGYPYDAVLVMHLHDFLHAGSVTNLERAVHLWNDAHETPKLRIATASEFFRYMEHKYGSVIPTVRGEWSGLWSEAKTSSPQISAMARRAHDEVPAAETLWSALAMQQSVPPPAGDFYKLYHLLFNYDEHSGAGNVGWPGLNTQDQLEEQNREYVQFMQEATGGAERLLASGIETIASANHDLHPRAITSVSTWPLAVWNALSWNRTGVVTTSAPAPGGHIVAIRDARNHGSIPFDIDERGDAVFLARDVPSIGYATYNLDVSPGRADSTHSTPVSSLTAENQRFRVALGPDGSIASIRDLQAKRELVNQKAEIPFNHLLRVAGDEPAVVPTPFDARITVKRGRIMTQMEVSRTGSAFSTTTIRLYDGVDRVDIDDRIRSDLLPFASLRSGFDSYYFSFPFALDPATLTVRPEEQYGFCELPKDYLPGARRDAVTAQHIMALTDADATVLLAHRQAFHFVFPGYVHTKATKPGSFPAIYTGKWPLPEATLYSKAFRHSSEGDMRFLGVTTFPKVEPGLGDEYSFDYAVSAAGVPFDATAAMRFGADFDVPLRPVYLAFAAEPAHSFFSVDQPNVEIDTVKPAEAGAAVGITPTNLENAKTIREFVIRLQEVGGRDTPRVSISIPGQVRHAEIVNLTEDKVIEQLPPGPLISVHVGAWSTVTVRIELETAH